MRMLNLRVARICLKLGKCENVNFELAWDLAHI